jgi:hypothetical protein
MKIGGLNILKWIFRVNVLLFGLKCTLALKLKRNFNLLKKNSLTKSFSLITTMWFFSTGFPLWNQWTLAVGYDKTTQSIVVKSPAFVCTIGLLTFTSGLTETLSNSIIMEMTKWNLNPTMNQHYDATYCRLSYAIIGNTLNRTRHIIMLHFDCQSTITIVGICHSSSVMQPRNHRIGNSFWLACNLKYAAQRYVHITTRISYDFGWNWERNLIQLDYI